MSLATIARSLRVIWKSPGLSWHGATLAGGALLGIFARYEGVRGGVVPYLLTALVWVTGAMLRLAWQIASQELASPNLIFGDPHRYTTTLTTGEERAVYSIPIRNRPRTLGPNGTATDVHGDLHVFDVAYKLVMTLQGLRWGDNIQPFQPDAPSNLLQLRNIDMPGDGLPHRLDYIVGVTGSRWYAFNLEDMARPYWTNTQHVITPGDPHLLRISVRGSNLEDQIRWVRFEFDEDGERVEMFEPNQEQRAKAEAALSSVAKR